MKKIIIPMLLAATLSACGGGGGGSSSNTSSGTSGSTGFPPSTSLAEQCAVPRPAGTINPVTGQPYNDVQGSLTTEMAWIASYVNETYLWYNEVPVVSSSPYVLNATVPYVNPTTNGQSTETLASNYDVVDAYFNSQRTPLFTASGKPKDQFHFTYTTAAWQALSAAGNQAGFGFEVALLSASPPRQALVAYTSPGTTATQNNVQRGAQILTVNGVDVANGTDLATLNEGLFSPVAGTSYTFQILDQGSSTPRTITMTAANITLTPVQNVGTLPAPNTSVGYILYNDQIATAESELIAAVNQLKAANNGAGISDLVLDIRYNGGGFLDLASEMAFMIASPAATSGTVFEQDTYNNKNPFNFTTAQTTVPFFSVSQGFSTSIPAGQALPQLGLSTVYVITGAGTCSASEAIMNGLLGVGVKVIQIGATTCGKPYGFFPQDNCSTTYFAIQFEGVNNLGFGAYADGFIPGGTGSTANNLPGCPIGDDFSKQLGDPTEARLAAALQYRNTGTCPAPSATILKQLKQNEPILKRSPARENRILRKQLD
ncbi:S41 family peptidase [Solimicrobium silvestre]|uniref:S41 family peptidase n=1 Tax=Solimicrobium silvestre TaxID=2099400 RepID=UPI0013FD112E|nr:S41 family peptidase [Solimicrobium silvestre]